MNRLGHNSFESKETSSKSERYLGTEGEKYFVWQKGWGDPTGKITARQYQKFLSPTDSVLDFGCGGGYLLKALICGRKLGYDINPAALKECMANSIEAVNDLGLIDQDRFDIAISNHSLEHVPSPLNSLREIHRVLRPGGTLLLCTPIDDWRRNKTYDPADINHHLFTWAPLNMGHLLSDAGFTEIQVSILTHAWPPRVVHLDKFLPLWLFNLLCIIWSVVQNQRQVFSIAKKHL